ncbi:MAG: helix-turn-helix domain-containing protein, partial [Nocardioides sp.]
MTTARRGARRLFAQRRRSLGFSQEKLAARLSVERSTVVRWEAGRNEPQAWLWPKLADALKVTPEQLAGLFAEGDEGLVPEVSAEPHEDARGIDRRGMLTAVGLGAASMGGAGDGRDLAVASARTSALLRANVETLRMGRATVDTARRRLRRLAAGYALASDLTTLRELVELRDELHMAAATRRLHPNDTRDIYVLLGATCALLASVSHDLSEPNAGMIHATTAETFAELAGHSRLLTWVHCTKAMIASWWASPAEVLRQVSKAHAVGVGGISAVRLTGLQARAL